MEYKYKQLEGELSGLSKLLADLGTRLSDAGREVTASAVLPSEKLVEQIAASRASFEAARTKVHGHAAAMLVSPLPKPDDLTSIAAMSSLLKGAAAAEENKYSTEGERDRALKALARALTLVHREVADFKPLEECHAKLAELRKAILNVTWPHRHPESESLAESRHPANALLHFVENLDTIEDEQWMALEATISGAYGKPLFVAATRGKLEIRGDKAESKPEPKTEAKVEVKPAPALPKPVVAAEKPVEKPVVVEEKIPEKPVVTPVAVAPAPVVPAVVPTVVPAAQSAPTPATKKIVIPAASAPPPAVVPAPVVVAEKKEAAPEKPAVVPQPVVMAPPAAAPVSATPVVAATPTAEPVHKVTITEKKETVDKPQPVLSPSLAPIPAVSVPPVAHAPAAIVSAPAPRAAAPVTAASAPVAAAPAPTPTAPPIPAAPPVSAAPANTTLNSLSALATATEPPIEKKTAVPVEVAEHQRRDARLAAPTPQPVQKGEASATNGVAAGEDQKTAEGDGQRPQRWGFWRGNR